MRKTSIIITITALFFILVSCKPKNEVDLKEVEPFYVNGIKVTPKKAKVDSKNLEVTLLWKNGTDEDSMNKESFLSTGTMFMAEQNGKELEWDLLTSGGLADDVYEGSEANIYPVFILDNTDDEVLVTMYSGMQPEAGKSFTVKLP